MNKPRYIRNQQAYNTLTKIVVGNASDVVVTSGDVETIILQEGYVPTRASIEKVLSASLERLKHIDEQLAEEVSILLPPRPSKILVGQRARLLGYELNALQLNRMLKVLKSKEGLFGTISAGATRAAQYHVEVKSPLDQKIVRALSKSTGLSRDKTISMVLRAFLQSFSVHGVDLATLVRTSTMSGDLAYTKALATVADRDLTNFVATTDVNFKLTFRQLETRSKPDAKSRRRPAEVSAVEVDGSIEEHSSPLWQLLERLRKARELRDKRKWSWYTICRELGMNGSLHKHWKLGARMRLVTARTLAPFFGVDASELLFPIPIADIELNTIAGRLDYLLERASIEACERLTWKEVHRQTGVRDTVISSVRSGHRKLSSNYATLLGDFFEVDPNWILGA